jgi:hypothetical protein
MSWRKVSDPMGLLGILFGLALLVWLAFRGWSVLLPSRAAALLAAAFAREPLLANWAQTFIGRYRRCGHRAHCSDRARHRTGIILGPSF